MRLCRLPWKSRPPRPNQNLCQNPLLKPLHRFRSLSPLRSRLQNPLPQRRNLRLRHQSLNPNRSRFPSL